MRVLGGPELVDQLSASRRELFSLRLNRATGQLENHREIRRVRIEIARLLTISRARELQLWLVAQTAAQPAAATERGPMAPEEQQT